MTTVKFTGFLLDEGGLTDTTKSILAAKYIIIKTTDSVVANVKKQYSRLPVYDDYPGYRVKIKVKAGTIAGRFKPKDLSRDKWAGHAFDIVASIRAYVYGNVPGYELILESADLVVQTN